MASHCGRCGAGGDGVDLYRDDEYGLVCRNCIDEMDDSIPLKEAR